MGPGYLAALLAAFTAVSVPALAEQFKCPATGGHLVYGQEADINSLDQMATRTMSTRNIAMNIYESLMTRDENNHPILELAAAMTESADRLTYTFRLRQGIRFHNGKPMTSADVVASFDRYARVGSERSMLGNVARWDAPDADTFVVHMKQPQPTFIEALSSYSAPIVIIPREERDAPALQLPRPIGTGPFKLADIEPGAAIRLDRYDGYQPNISFQQRTGLGGYKQACLDTVTFRIMTEPGARAAGLRSGELQVAEDLPVKAVPELRKDIRTSVLDLPNWWIQLATPNTSAAPTDNLLFRKAVQAALDMDEIMAAASDGNYRLNAGFQYAGQPGYSDAGKGTYNIHDAGLARKYLAQAGYQGEPVILLTNKDYPSMYNSALAVQQQLQAIGVNAQMKVLDWPTSVRMWRDSTEGWNFFFTGWGTQPALGPLATMQLLIQPNAAYKPKDGKDDPDLLAAWTGMNMLPTPDGRHEAFGRMQGLVLDKVYAIPFGSFIAAEGMRSNVNGFVPFPVARMANVWLGR